MNLKKAGFRTEAVAVLRPDRFAFAVIAPSELDRTVRQLHDKLGLQLGARKSIVGTSITTPSVAKAA
ncbi:hypothetical protein [Burkholderia pseudomultivorans]|uniref:hypothetical protein n=1 Tax=Burkholderia pseudomultivorans TaxID=1207504 RepID=UPI001E56B650|nr:hypothetical protein [Burkholderia pseudomultivorans]